MSASTTNLGPAASEKDIKYLRWADAGAEIFSTCSKGQYLAIVVDRFGIVAATGYNGAPSGMIHCADGGCPRATVQHQGGSYSDCVSIHAEANALLRVSRQDCEGATIYVTGLPCWDCAKLIVGSGIRRIVHKSGRRPIDFDQVQGFLELNRIVVVNVDLGVDAAQLAAG